jgi:hypothetical protein
MGTGDEFVKLFNELRSVLQEKTGLGNDVAFPELVDAASARDVPTRRRNRFLKSAGALRNAIVHSPNYPPEVIADPRPKVVRQFRDVLEAITSPARVIPRFQREIRSFTGQEHFGAALKHMQENDYSQVVVQLGREYQILSSEGIVRWLSGSRELGLADLDGTTVEDVCRSEDKKGQSYMPRNETVDAALLKFERAIAEGVPRLPAILITNNGKPTERPIGIITPWDLLGLGDNNDVASKDHGLVARARCS